MAFFRLTGGFWTKKSRRLAWGLTLGVLAAMLLQIASQVATNAWHRYFFDALERKSLDGVWSAASWLPLVILASVVSVTSVVVTRLLLQARWREWVTDRLAGWWIADQRYYRLGLVAPDQSAPEFRIADDVRLSVEPLVEFITGLLSATITAMTFATILWSVAGSYRLTVGGSSFEIPAYMAVAAVVYAVIASTAAAMFGRPLVSRVAAKNEAEAQLRAEMTRLRENAESIALIRGDRDELASIRLRYVDVLSAWMKVIRQQGILGLVLNTHGALFPIVPLILVTPKYLSGELTLGAVMQVVASFAAVQGALIWFVDNSVRLAEWFASAGRVLELTSALEELDDATQAHSDSHIQFAPSEDDSIYLEGLSIADRAGRTVIADTDVVIRTGERVVVGGESGTGKTTLIRALAGLWPWGSGTIRLPAGKTLAFVPQRPYLPLDTLRAAVTYPASVEAHGDEAVVAALRRCGLGYLVKALDDTNERWDQRLSGGERQRIAFCRLLLQRPDIIIMDEATSALDDDSQTSLLSLLHEELSHATVISVVHRAGVEEFHDRKILLERRATGAAVRQLKLSRSLWHMLRRATT